MGLIHLAQHLHHAIAKVARVGLTGMKSVDVDTGDIDIGTAVHQPLGENPANAASGENAQ